MVDSVAYTTCVLTDYTLVGAPSLPPRDADNVTVEGQSMSLNMHGHCPLGNVGQHVTAADPMLLNSHLSSGSKACSQQGGILI